MNTKPTTSKTVNVYETKQNNFTSKLRRLKIEENILLQSLKKLDLKCNYEVIESYTTTDLECKSMIKTLKDSYLEIRNLFDDIKIITNSQELLADVEIDEIKKKVLELETTMRSFKLHMNTELNSLKSAEQELTRQLEELHYRSANIKKRAKISSASFKQATTVPSPVRLLMTSPLKCSEVQEFQDFLTSSPNRYGGWNEYYHNIFVMLWQKHFENHLNLEFQDSYVEKLAFGNFIEESLIKLQGIDRDNLMSHIDWYKKYLFLKSKQQSAIDKWKSNRRSIKKLPERDQKQNTIPNYFNIKRGSKCVNLKKELTKSTQKVLCIDDIERLTKPTKQWLSRCDFEQVYESNSVCDIESLEKLRIPNWRQQL